MRSAKLARLMALTVLICGLFSAFDAAAQEKAVNLDSRVHTLGDVKSVPAQLNYQGYLADASDSSAVTATLEMTFRLFDAETKGTELWSETHPTVEVSEGLFQVLLGSLTAFPPNLFDNAELWLQTEVGAEVLAPRKPLVSVAYSQRTVDADHAATAEWAENAQHAVHADTADYSPSADAWIISGDDIYRQTGHVGIGTISPSTELDVNGSVNATSYYGDGSHLTGISGTTDNDWTISGDNISSGVSGNVGIGTTSPSAKLDIRGTLNVGADGNGHDVNFYGAQSGSRLFWDGEKMAFRVGQDTDGTHWDPDSIGLHSIALGKNSKASEECAIAIGHTSTANGATAIAIGQQIMANGYGSMALGYGSVSAAPYSISIGTPATAAGLNSVSMGWMTETSAAYATAIGISSEAQGEFSTAIGIKAVASGDRSFAMGRFVTAQATNSYVLGRGVDEANPIVNNIPNSLMVGFNDLKPTLFVGGSDKRVGIATSAPQVQLDVADMARVRGHTWPGHGEGMELAYDSTSHKGYIQVYNRDASAPDDWGQLYLGSGEVGIGVTNPGVKLQVSGGTDVDDETQNSGYFIIGPASGQHLAFDNNEFMSKGSGSSTAPLYIQNEGGNIYIGGDVGIGNTDPTEKLDVSGTARLRDMSILAGSGYNVVTWTSGELYKEGSSRKYLDNIKYLTVNGEKVMQLQPVRFRCKETNREDVGLIAEDVERSIPELVVHDQEGNPDAVRYDKITIYLLELAKAQQERISKLEKQVAELKTSSDLRNE